MPRLVKKENDFWAGISETWKYGDRLKSWEPHDTHNWTLLLAFQGDGIVYTSESEYHLNKSSILLLEPNLAHKYSGINDWGLIWVHFLMSPEIIKNLLWPETAPGIRYLQLSPIIFSKIKLDLMDIYSASITRKHNWYRYVMALLTTTLLRIDNEITTDGFSNPEWISDAMQVLADTNQKLDMNTIAHNCGLSRTAFFNEFRKATGYSPRTYREMKIMREAEQMLVCTDYTVSEIAWKIGFDNPFYFSMRFKKYYGQSPKAYRDAKLNL